MSKNNIQNLLRMLPLDFDPKIYRLLNHDINYLLTSDFDCVKHYLEYGHKESRPYKIISSINKKVEFWNNGNNLLYFSPIAPDYDMSSGGNRLLYILDILKNYLKYNIWFLCNGFKDIKHIKKLQQMNIPVYLPDIKNNQYLDVYLKKAQNNNIVFDNAIFSWYDMAYQYIDIVKFYYPNIKVIADSVDVHWLREQRGKNSNMLNISQQVLLENKEKEKNVYKKSDVVLAVTKNDQKFIKQEIGIDSNVKILSNIHEKINLAKKNNNILFIGNYDHQPNIDAAKQCIVIYEKFRQTKEYQKLQHKPKLLIVGPNSKKLNISNTTINKNILLMDHIDNLNKVYEQSTVLLAPLNWGAGIKGKICDCAMCKMLIVTSPIGNEGINLVDNVNGFIANNINEFVLKLQQIYSMTTEQQDNIGFLGQNHIHNIVSKEAAINVLKNTLRNKHIVISIISFNNKNRLFKCLLSIINNTTYNNYTIIITDNSTSDDIKNSIDDFITTYDMLNKIKYHKNTQNEYFIIPNNRIMLDKNYENSDIVLINDDIEIIEKNWLTYMYSSAYSSNDICCVGGKTIFPDGRLAEAGAELYNDGYGRNIGRYENPDKPEYNYSRYVGYCSGCLLYMKKSIIKKLGVFNEKFYPMYYEDSEWQYRCHIHGYKTLYDYRVKAIHDEGSSAGNNIDSGAKKHQETNRIKFLEIMKNLNCSNIEIYNE